MEWQDIETAPRDLPILVWFENLPDSNREEVGYSKVLTYRGKWWCSCSKKGVMYDNPTHWRPLPKPPINKESI